MRDLILDCTTGIGAGNTHTYDIKHFPSNATGEFCITGRCNYDSGSSSSEGGGGDSSSSGGVGYSSDSGGYPFGESCEIGSYYWNYMSGYGVFKRTLYPLLPYMLKKNEMYVSGCGCSGDNLVYCQLRNFEYVHDYRPNTLSLCSYSHGYWCEGIESGGGTTCDFSGKSAYIYHTDIPGYEWLVNSMADNYLYPLGGQSSEFGIVHDAGKITQWREVFFTLGYSLPTNVSESDLVEAILSALPDFPSLDKMHAYCRGEWVPHDEDCFGTQSEAYKAMGDSVFVCGSLGGITGYSLDLSGRGWCVEGGCELKDEASSSSGGSPSSSSNVSSSSQEATIVCKENKRGVDAVYTVSDCFSSGLDNMEQGKCYSLNPDRGTQYGWINNNAQDSWWWREVSCGGESGGSNECSESVFLQKKSTLEKDSEYAKEDISYDIWKNKTQFLFDALGRRTQVDPKVRRYLFSSPKKDIIDNKIESYSEIGLLRVMPDNSECGVIGKDYGIVLGNGQRRGGVTCLYFDVSYSYPKSVIRTSILEDTDCICGGNSKLLKVEGGLYYELDLEINDIYYVPVGYIFSDGYKVTKSDETAIREHELRHKRDNESIIKGVSGTAPINVIICSDKFNSSFRTEFGDKLILDKKLEYIAKIRAASDNFHQQCYLEGFCE